MRYGEPPEFLELGAASTKLSRPNRAAEDNNPKVKVVSKRY
jgi:hypothetical protein